MSYPLRRHARLILLALGLWAWFITQRVEADGPREILIGDASAFQQGTLEGVILTSRGELIPGERFERLAIDEESLAFSVAVDSRGRVYAGTGPRGAIYSAEDGAPTRFGEVDGMLVSALAIGPKDVLYAAALPGAKIYRFDRRGKRELLAKLEDAEHIWALVYDERRKALIAATGPNGKLFSIDTRGNVREIFASDSSHLLSLALEPEGSLLVGTDGEALLYRIHSDDRAELLLDLNENEIRGILPLKDGIYLVANEMPAPPPAAKLEAQDQLMNQLDRAKHGKGRLYRLDASGRFERLLARLDGHFTAIAESSAARPLITQAGKGRIFTIDEEDQPAIVGDLEDEQLLGIVTSRKSGVFIVSGNGAAIHRPENGSRSFTSRVYDMGFGTQLGRIAARGEGLIEFSTRTGPRKTPDDSWTDWSTPIRTPGPVRSPSNRFFQIRATFPEPGHAILRALRISYLSANQPARVTNIRIETDEKAEAGSTLRQLAWDVENPDGDDLRYRLFFRAEGQSLERPITREDTIHRTNRYAWEIAGIPDGYYRVIVEASDELANSPDRTLKRRTESAPLLVDHHAPEIVELRTESGKVIGKAIDSFSDLSKIELAIDGQPYRLYDPLDGIIDSPEEEFAIELKDLQGGTYLISVRVTDAAGNSAVREIEMTIPR